MDKIRDAGNGIRVSKHEKVDVMKKHSLASRITDHASEPRGSNA